MSVPVGYKFKRHGLSATSEYHILQGMKDRCYNKNSKQYSYYGGRGITVCERWLQQGGIVNFIEDMGLRPAKHSIDRINNDGNYEPSNCRWATAKVQANNKRQHTYTPPEQREKIGNAIRTTWIGKRMTGLYNTGRCQLGIHPFVDSNIYIYPKKGIKTCKMCKNRAMWRSKWKVKFLKETI